MITLRRAVDRGHADHGWLRSHHSFSFAEYMDPAHMGFGNLRVLNDDTVAPGTGFGTHGHRDMEILTLVLEGELRHQDSMGNGSVIRRGRVQRMSAGTGMLHSEVNASADKPVHLIQIWILPDEERLTPEYEEREIDPEETRGKLRLIASRDGRDGSLKVHQDASLWLSTLTKGEAVSHGLAPGRHAWLQVARGTIALNGQVLETGDGAAVSDELALTIEANDDSEVLLFDLA